VKTGQNVESLPFEVADAQWPDGVSGMWRGLRRGSAASRFAVDTANPYIAAQSQRMTHSGGEGEIGVENQSLNRWGMNFVAGKPYEGYLWLRADEPVEVHVALESADGSRVYGETPLAVSSTEWKRLDFNLTPSQSDKAGRFAVKLKQPGSVVIGHAFLQPGEWGRFKGLPVRKDIADGLIAQGLTVLRLGGLMANAEEYRWKKMIGPRDRRPPYKGFWYPYSTNGWGIIEFLDFCEAANFLAIPDFNMDETPADMVDFVEYANGPADSEWGRRRAADGHPEPYNLKYIQLGNEEAVDETYWQKFKPLAEAIWKKDPQIIVIVGDFEYKQPITDPYNFEGAPKIKSLAAHKKILDLAKANNRPVWFDVHIWNHNPRDSEAPITALSSFIEQLTKLSPGAAFEICVLEENANTPAVRRALSHARTINGLMRMGDRVRIVCAANCLQPYKQNDNGWDQGMLFLTPSQVWGQPPYYVTQMVARNNLPQCVQAEAQSPADALDVTARTSADGRVLTLQVVNLEGRSLRTRIDIDGFGPLAPVARVTEITGELDDVNTPEDPKHVASSEREWRWGDDAAAALKTFGNMGKQVRVLEGGKEAELYKHDGRGCLTHMWFGGDWPGYGRTRLRVYVDGETKASIDMELMLGHGIGFEDDASPWGVERIGKTGHPSGIYNTYRIPFGKGVRVTAQLPEDVKENPEFWWIIRGTENLPVEIAGVRLPDSARLRLYTR
ncbi:MAG: hypothetical protein M3478_09200, partial [Planctomycetota bacterium]|nr:hypothetical protein [Planctomycetota bacterium]